MKAFLLSLLGKSMHYIADHPDQVVKVVTNIAKAKAGK